MFISQRNSPPTRHRATTVPSLATDTGSRLMSWSSSGVIVFAAWNDGVQTSSAPTRSGPGAMVSS